MLTEEKKSENRKILDKTQELTALLKNSTTYRDYCKKLVLLRKQPDLYKQLNAFRRSNLELQMQNYTDDYEDKADKLQRQYNNTLMEPVVMNFLLSEQAMCEMMREVYDVLYKEIYLDISYMDED